MIPLIVLAAVILLLGLGVRALNSPAMKGKRGERIVAARLRDGLPEDYQIINDIYLPLPDGTTTQIDHIVVSRYGIFVVETKNYSGWISGEEKSTKWTQSIYRKKSSFQNPIRQNYRHVCALADNLGIDKRYFVNVVAFTGDCEFKTEMPPGVVYSRKTADFIRSFTSPIIKDTQIGELVEAISLWQNTITDERKKSHVGNLKKRHETVSANDAPPLCPLCGDKMILRRRKSDGRQFYGCCNYPKCKGIRNIA